MNSNPQNVICLYSKFSEHSKKFVEMSNTLPINFICIDNKKVRQLIISDQKLQITFVPCILSVFSDGRLEKYEGPDAFEWLKKLKNDDHQQPVTQQPVTQQQVSPPQVNQKPVTQQPVTQENNENDQNQFSQHDFHSQQMREKHSKITDLNFEGNNEKISKVSSGMKNSLDDRENIINKNINKISTKNSGKKNVMAAAREMEKIREKEEQNKKRPPNMPKI